MGRLYKKIWLLIFSGEDLRERGSWVPMQVSTLHNDAPLTLGTLYTPPSPILQLIPLTILRILSEQPYYSPNQNTRFFLCFFKGHRSDLV